MNQTVAVTGATGFIGKYIIDNLLARGFHVRALTRIKCDLCSFDEQGPACVRMCPTKALHLVDNTDIARVSKRKRELTFNTDFGDLTLFQQAQSGEAK